MCTLSSDLKTKIFQMCTLDFPMKICVLQEFRQACVLYYGTPNVYLVLQKEISTQHGKETIKSFVVTTNATLASQEWGFLSPFVKVTEMTDSR